MKKSNKSHSNVQDSKINELMSSIQSKLELLAKDQLEYDMQFNLSQPASLQYEMLSPNKSSNHQHSNLKSHMGSPILSRISQIQEKYISKLTVLNQKITLLENQNNEIKAANRKLEVELEQERQKLKLIECEQERILDRKVEEMKENLLSRMKDEVEQEIEGYIRELSLMREQLGSHRLQKKKLEKEMELLRFERHNFEEMYMDIMSKFKQFMQSEVSSYEKHRHQNVPLANIPNQDRLLYKPTYNPQAKKKTQKNKSKKTAELSKQKLIPFLAKGIEELKQKLNLK